MGIELREIPGYPTKYAAGSDGHIYSKANRKMAAECEIGWYKLKSRTNMGKYQRVNIIINGKHKTKSVHRLVCEAWHGAPTEDKPHVCHWDGSRDNNIPENLRWGSAKDNADDAIRHGRTVGCRGEKHYKSKVTDIERDELIGLWVAGGQSQKSIGILYGLSNNGVHSILRRAGCLNRPGYSNGNSALTDADIEEANNLINDGHTQQFIADMLGVHQVTISNVTKNRKG